MYFDSDTIQYSYMARAGDSLYVIGITAESHLSIVTLQLDGSSLPVKLVSAPWITSKHKFVHICICILSF